MRTPVTALLVFASIGAGAEWEKDIPRDHPRLLIHRDGLAALRKRCGVAAYRDALPAEVPFGASRLPFERVRAAADLGARGRTGVGWLYAAALCHLVLGEPGIRDGYVELVEGELRHEEALVWPRDDVVIALDWCWDALDRNVRQTAATALVRRMKPLSDEVTPFDHVGFHPRLCDVAAAIVLFDPRPVPGDAGHAAQIRTVLDAASKYIRGPFVRMWNEKGPAPSSPTNDIWAQADAVFAAEIWATGVGRPLWPELGESLGRSFEWYFWTYTGHAATPYGFPNDDGNWAPDRPGLIPADWPAAVPWVLAARTNRGLAEWFTTELHGAGSGSQEATAPGLLWPRVLYGEALRAGILRQACPLARHIPRGFVVLRSDWSPSAVVVLADVGQPFWRSRQHYDAGHFQILRGGLLTSGAGDDVAFDAVPSRGGDSGIDRRPADWDAFARATIAHNCITVASNADLQPAPERGPRPVGNQREISRDYRPSDPPVDATGRVTGRLIAFETNSFYSYAAADLALAYPVEQVKGYVRHFLLLNAGALFVCDSITVAPNTTATWHLQIPERPRAAGGDLPESARLAGNSNEAGIWKVPADGWIDTARAEGRLFVRTLLPAGARARLIGGPRAPRTIAGGAWQGFRYFGGDEDGYEHRLAPALLDRAPQAWFRLGQPRDLSPHFGLRSMWGRLDVAPPIRDRSGTFLHVFVPTDIRQAQPPPLDHAVRDDMATVNIALPTARCTVTWRLNRLGPDGSAGRVEIFSPATGEKLFQKELSDRVEPERPLPGSGS